MQLIQIGRFHVQRKRNTLPVRKILEALDAHPPEAEVSANMIAKFITDREALGYITPGTIVWVLDELANEENGKQVTLLGTPGSSKALWRLSPPKMTEQVLHLPSTEPEGLEQRVKTLESQVAQLLGRSA